MNQIIQSIVAALSKTLSEVLGTKVLAAVGAFLTLTAAHQYDEAALIAIAFLGIGGAREVVKTITAGKTDTAVAEATTAVATAPAAAATAAASVADTLTPETADAAPHVEPDENEIAATIAAQPDLIEDDEA